MLNLIKECNKINKNYNCKNNNKNIKIQLVTKRIKQLNINIGFLNMNYYCKTNNKNKNIE